MFDTPKQLTAEQALERLNAFHIFSEAHIDKWRNQVAWDLNELIARAEYSLTVTRDESDIAFSNAVLRIVERVAEFEEIERRSNE